MEGCTFAPNVLGIRLQVIQGVVLHSESPMRGSASPLFRGFGLQLHTSNDGSDYM